MLRPIRWRRCLRRTAARVNAQAAYAAVSSTEQNEGWEQMMGMLGAFLHWCLYGIPAFLFLITVVVFFHELGHFATARLFGVRVETFSIGFGRALYSWTDKLGTRWKISWVPLGGFGKFFVDTDGTSRPDRQAATQMSPADRAAAFQFKPLWQRALVVAAGPA